MARALQWGAGILGGLLLLIVAAALAAVWFVDGHRLAGWVAERASAALEREVRVEDARIAWSWSPRLTLSGLTIANAPWGTEPLMAEVEQVQAVVRIPPLLRGRIEIPEITIVRPSLLLEKNQEGEGNWQLREPVAAEPATPEDRSEFPLMGRLAVQDGVLRFNDPKKGVEVESRINTVAGSGGGGEDRVSVDGQGSLQGKPFRISLSAGPILVLRQSDAPYPVDLSVEAGETSVLVKGTFRDPVKFQGADLDLDLKGPDLSEIFPLFGIPTPVTAAYSLKGKLRRDEGIWQVEGLQGRVGESDLSGVIRYEPKEPRPLIRGTLTSRQLRFADLGGLIGLDPAEGDKKRETPGPDARVIPDTPIDLDRLKAADMDVTFTGDDVQVPVLPLEQVQFRLLLNNGKAVIDPVRFTASIGRVVGRIILDGTQEVPLGRFDLGIEGLGLKPFVAGTRFEPETEGRLGGRLDLTGRGRSLSSILAASDGRIVLVMEGGSVSHLLIEAAGLDIAEALGTLVSGDDAVGVRCLVADLPVERGRMTTRTFIFDTTDTNIAADLTLALGDEALAGRVVAAPKDPSPLAARVPVTLGGTLSQPRIGIEGGPAAVKGGAAVALGVLLTPLAAIIPFLEEGGGEDSPCRALIQSANSPEPPANRRRPAGGKRPG